jgi:3-oxoadipate enol-lactonase
MKTIDLTQFREDAAVTARRISVSGARDGGASAGLFCIEDDYTDAWQTADTVVMLHGIAERAEIWRAWVPHFARDYRVLRVDLRGFGRTRVHLVAAKLGALVAFELAQRQRPWLASMTLAGMLPSPAKSLGPWIDEWLAMVEGEGNGVERWAETTMPGRMGSSLSPEAMQWWAHAMGTAPAATVAACFRLLPGIDGPSNPEGVRCPTLFVAAGAPAVTASEGYNQRPAASDLQRLRERVAGSKWVEVPADSYHIAATHPDDCARATLAFLQGVDGTAKANGHA